MNTSIEVYRKIVKINIKMTNPELFQTLFEVRKEMVESIIKWAKPFYKLRDSLDYQVLFHMWKENKQDLYKQQMFSLLKKYHLSYDDFKAAIQKDYPQYYEIFYSMNKKVYRRFVDAVLNERSLGYFNEKIRKIHSLILTPYNKVGHANLNLQKGYIDFETIHLNLDLVDCILLENYQQIAYLKSYTLKENGILEMELILQDDGSHFDIECMSQEMFMQRLF